MRDLSEATGNFGGNRVFSTWQSEDLANVPFYLALAIDEVLTAETNDKITFKMHPNWKHDAYKNTIAFEYGYYWYSEEDNYTKRNVVSTKHGTFTTPEHRINWEMWHSFTVDMDNTYKKVILPFFKIGGVSYGENPEPGWHDYYGALLIHTVDDKYASSFNLELNDNQYPIAAARVIAGKEDGTSDAAEYGFVIPPRGTAPNTPIQSIVWPTQNEPNKVELKWTYGSISTSPSNEPVSYTVSVRKNGQDINNLWEDVFSDELNDVTEGSIGSYVYEMSPNGRYEYQLTLHSNAGSTTVNFDNAIVYSQPIPPTIEYAYVSGGKLTCQINNEVNMSDDLASSGTQISPWSIDNAADNKEVRVRAYFEQDNKTIYSDYSTGIMPVKVIIPWLNIDYQFNQE